MFLVVLGAEWGLWACEAPLRVVEQSGPRHEPLRPGACLVTMELLRTRQHMEEAIKVGPDYTHTLQHAMYMCLLHLWLSTCIPPQQKIFTVMGPYPIIRNVLQAWG